MTSFLITHTDPNKREKYVRDYCVNQKISPFDISFISKEEIATTKKAKTLKLSLGIEDIKNMQRLVHFAPMKSLQKAVILQDAQTLTIEAQNALLKLLEEPPPNTLIFLLSENEEALLPTIQSRCSIISLKEETSTINEKIREDYAPYILLLQTLTTASSLELAEKLGKTKEDSLKHLSIIITLLRERYIEKKLIDKKYSNMYTLIQTLQDSYTRIKTTNINPRLTIENALLAPSS